MLLVQLDQAQIADHPALGVAEGAGQRLRRGESAQVAGELALQELCDLVAAQAHQRFARQGTEKNAQVRSFLLIFSAAPALAACAV